MIAILKTNGLTVYNYGQARIHYTLSLVILAAIPAKAESGAVLKDVLFRGHELGLTVSFTPVTPESYDQWVRGQGKPRHIITLLGRTIEAIDIAKVKIGRAHV